MSVVFFYCDKLGFLFFNMKFNIYIVIFSLFILRRTSSLDQKYNLLQPPDGTAAEPIFESDLSSSYYNFTEGKTVLLDASAVELVGKTLSSPFIVTAIFKSYTGKSSCPFSIEQNESIVLRLCMDPAGKKKSRISLSSSLYSPNDAIIYRFKDSFKEKWMNIVIYVNNENAYLYVDCINQKNFTSLKPGGGVVISKDARIRLAFSNRNEDIFQGAIQEINLYTHASEDTLKYEICTQLEESYSTEPSTTSPVPFIPIKGENGMKGEKGDMGVKGQKGDLGPQGPIGPTGPMGKKGDEGTCQCSEEVVSTLLLSMPEMKGPAGERGLPGFDGKAGPTGLTGNIGPQGDRGPQGLRGETGERGDDGVPGKVGAPGPRGEPGRNGTPGPPGEKGAVGPQGSPGPIYVETEEEKNARIVKIPGERGDPGPIGPPGTPGQKGDKGDSGPKGETGLKGIKGDEGRIGLQGIRGEKGNVGEAGENGIPGNPGNPGRPAEKGVKGDKGDKGVPGQAGVPASLSSILDTKMDPDENAAIVEKLKGSKGDRGETGEKGVKGDYGSIGAKGPRGDDGKDGAPGKKGEVGLKGELGHKGDRGEPGPPGQVPASQIALMKGAKGDRGQDGRKGQAGYAGSKGIPGEKGPVGPKGQKGDTGALGPMGPIGPPGFNGTAGAKGDKGDSAPTINLNNLKGDKGDRGLTGNPGNPGEAGPIGPPGTCPETSYHAPIPGPPGPPGAPGRPGVSIVGPKGDPGVTIIQDTNTYIGSGDPDDEDYFYSTNTVVYRTKRGLMKKTEKTKLGTLVYVIQEKILLLRVENGWEYVLTKSYIDSRPHTTSTTLKPPEPASLRPYYIEPSRILPTKHSRKGFIRMVALNEPYTGALLSNKKGIEGARRLCHKQSRMYNLGGTFSPFLATRLQHLISIVDKRDRDLPVVSLKGNTLFDSWSSIFNGSRGKFTYKPSIYSFNGRSVLIDPIWPSKTVWHGSRDDSEGSLNREANCDNWKSDSQDHNGVASSLNNNRLLGYDVFPCDSKFIVLCVEVNAYKSPMTVRRKRHHRPRNFNLLL